MRSCRSRLNVVRVLLIVVTTSCSDDGNDRFARPESPPGGPTSVAPVASTGVVVPVITLDNSFRPQQIEVRVGDEVVWENRGRNEHNVLSIEDGAWGVEVADFGRGATYSHVFSEPGQYRYFCSTHGNEEVGMVGTVIVTE